MGYIGAGPTRFNTADELTVTGDAEFNGNLTVKGTTTTIDSASVQTVDLGDNDKIRLGDGDDLQIYHDGSNSYIQDVGTGNLFIQGESAVYIRDNAGAAMAVFNDGGAVQLRYNGLEKLATTSTGVDVTGEISSNKGSAGTLATFTDGVNSNFVIETASLITTVGNTGGSTALAFKSSNTERMRIDSNGNVGIGTTSPVRDFVVQSPSGQAADLSIRTGDTTSSAVLHFGDSDADNQGQIVYQNSDDSMSFNTSTGLAIKLTSSGKVGIGTTTNTTHSLFIHDSDYQQLGLSGTRPTIFLKETDGSADENYQIRVQNGNLQFETQNDAQTGSTERMRINSNGNVSLNGLSNGTLAFSGGNTADGSKIQAFNNAGNGNGYLAIEGFDKEYMRIDSSGNLLLGTTSAIASGFYSSSFDGATKNGIVLKTTLASNGTDFIRFINSSGSVIGEIEQNSASTVAYLTSSDYRLKTAVTYDWDATTRLKQLRPARFEWIADGDNAVPVDGFLAHEVQDIVPEAISGTKDAMRDEEYQVSAATGDIYTPATEAVLDEDGNEVTPAVAEVIHSTDVERPEELAEGQLWRETTAAVMGTRSVPDYQGIDQSKLVPLLVKTIQELEARITALETA